MNPALRCFRVLPLAERLFVRARVSSAPLEAMAALAPVGRVADVGCGHGALTALLAADSRREVLGIDPDDRKVAWARLALGGAPNVTVERTTLGELASRRPHEFDGVLVADVLYLLPDAEWLGFLRHARQLLRPGGRLLLKEAESDGTWKAWKCRAQEALMVRVLGRTHSSGGLGFKPRQHLEGLLVQAGFSLERTTSLARGYTTPHVLFVASA